MAHRIPVQSAGSLTNVLKFVVFYLTIYASDKPNSRTLHIQVLPGVWTARAASISAVLLLRMLKALLAGEHWSKNEQ